MVDILLFDNIDFFMYNLVDQLCSNGYNVVIYCNYILVQILIECLVMMSNLVLMFFFGFGVLSEVGCMLEFFICLCGKLFIIGICFGYQVIVEVYGGYVGQVGEIFYGKVLSIEYDGQVMFVGLTNLLLVVCYYLLVGSNILVGLIINVYFNGMVMVVCYDVDCVCGFQFYLESIFIIQGVCLLE